MGEGQLNVLRERGRLAPYPNAKDVLAMCAFCGRGNTFGLVILSAVLVVLGLSLYPLSVWGKSRYERERARAERDGVKFVG